MMRPAHPIEREIGIEYYVSETDGIGGRLRDRDEDFRVRELERFDVKSVEADPDAYPHLVLRARLAGWDTNDFAARLSDALGISRERIRWAGTKDKHAVTTQLFSVDAVDPADLPSIRDIDLEIVGRAGRSLHFGDLAGNAFGIVVRDPERPEHVGRITDELVDFGSADRSVDPSAVGDVAVRNRLTDAPTGARIGVPNFFGHQRFGSHRPVTHAVGLAIVRGDWRDAVMAYLGGPRASEPADTREARGLIDDGADWQTALESFPRGLRYERSMLHRLVETGGETDRDFRRAIEAVPSSLQRLFVNAAQSLLFNRILSERLRRGLPFGRAVEGDVACFVDQGGPADVILPDPDREQRVTVGRVDAVNRHCARDRAFVTAPLIGTETTFGSDEPGEIERAVLDDAGIERADFDLPGDFHSTGTRRAILLRTDLTVESDPPTFSFSLPKGSYATVVLREYLKIDPRSM